MPDVDINRMYDRFNRLGKPYSLNFQPNELLPNTRLALEATEFARDKNSFSQFHAAVFKAYFTDGKDIGNLPVLLDIAGEVGLDGEELKNALENKIYAPRIEANRKLARDSQVRVLPTFLAEDWRIVGIQPDEVFVQKLKKNYP